MAYQCNESTKMILFNTTFHIHTSIDKDFTQWIRENYIPAAKSAGIFTDIEFVHILIPNDPDAKSYAVQMKAPSKAEAEKWHDNDGSRLKSILTSRYGERFLFFTTYMEILAQ